MVDRNIERGGILKLKYNHEVLFRVKMHASWVEKLNQV